MDPLRASMPSCLRQWSCRVNLLSLKIGSLRLGSVYLIRRTGQHILVNEEEIRIFAFFDAASFIFNEHLL